MQMTHCFILYILATAHNHWGLPQYLQKLKHSINIIRENKFKLLWN